jgi:hypothetical protein
MFFRKPPVEGAIVLTASQLLISHLADQKFRLVDVRGNFDGKIRPHKGEWPLILSALEDDDIGDYPTEARSLVAVTTEDKPNASWYFGLDTELILLPVEEL